jgi:glycosyltransferase involved in cell wall biosynthesis
MERLFNIAAANTIPSNQIGSLNELELQLIARTRPLRILMVTQRYFPEMGGTEAHVHEVSKRIAERGHSIEILTTDRSGDLPVEEVMAGVLIKRVRAWPKSRDYYFAPQIYSEIMQGNWDIIHIQGYHTLVAPLAMFASLRKGTPFVITFHSGGHSSRVRTALRGLQWMAIGPLVRRASHWIGVSQFEANFFSDKMGLSRDKFAVIPNGALVLDPAKAHRSAPGDGPIILSIGRLERYKGHHRAIAAFPEVLRRFPDARLQILGDGPYKYKLHALINELRLDEPVTIASIPPGERERLASTIGAASLVVLLSDYEAHPVAVVEALALRRPVLTTYCSGLMEIVQQGLARAVPLNACSMQIAEAIIAQLESRPSPSEVELPTWERCTDKIIEIYCSVIEKGSNSNVYAHRPRVAPAN